MYQGDYRLIGSEMSFFTRKLDALAIHFTNSDFLLGNRPCLADFALAGVSKAHFICDPEPKSWLGKHSDMLNRYTSQFFADWPDELPAWPADDQIPATLTALLDYLQDSYYQSAPANIAAGLAGEKFYEFDMALRAQSEAPERGQAARTG